MMNVIRKFLVDKPSGVLARERMQFVLLHDRLDITPEMMESLKNDIVEVLSRYVELDKNSIQVNVERSKGTTALISNVLIKRVFTKPSYCMKPSAASGGSTESSG